MIRDTERQSVHFGAPTIDLSDLEHVDRLLRHRFDSVRYRWADKEMDSVRDIEDLAVAERISTLDSLEITARTDDERFTINIGYRSHVDYRGNDRWLRSLADDVVASFSRASSRYGVLRWISRNVLNWYGIMITAVAGFFSGGADVAGVALFGYVGLRICISGYLFTRPPVIYLVRRPPDLPFFVRHRQEIAKTAIGAIGGLAFAVALAVFSDQWNAFIKGIQRLLPW